MLELVTMLLTMTDRAYWAYNLDSHFRNRTFFAAVGHRTLFMCTNRYFLYSLSVVCVASLDVQI